jgi:diadenosine tetraphosphate (Ap4A) HIT family hydrolase
MTDCVFCKLRDGQIPSMKIYEDDLTIAFMDINPINSGHCLIITKAHAANLYEAELADLQAAMATAQRVATAIRDGLKPDAEHDAGQRTGRVPVGAALPPASHPPVDQRRQGLRLEAGAGQP